jgi:hypothetical protein
MRAGRSLNITRSPAPDRYPLTLILMQYEENKIKIPSIIETSGIASSFKEQTMN